MKKKIAKVIKVITDALPVTIKKPFIAKKNREELFDYWRDPNDGKNNPEVFLEKEGRTIFLLELIKKYIKEDDAILEIGCNVGRNLYKLFSLGFKDISGVEISANAIELMQKTYPDMAGQVRIFNEPAETVILKLENNSFDMLFTTAVLEHIHTESEFVFPHMVRVTKKYLITIEDEKGTSWRHFPRNYKKVFEDLGMRQIEEVSLKKIKVNYWNKNFVARVFEK